MSVVIKKLWTQIYAEDTDKAFEFSVVQSAFSDFSASSLFFWFHVNESNRSSYG